MNINRHNYEDYFMLYMDNELSQAEKKAVEDFLLMNPDLKGEMDSLKMTILSPDTDLVFKGKEELIFSESNTVNTHNYESFLVQYVDGELSPEQIIGLESFLASNPNAQHELDLFTKTKLADQSVVFADKSSLYRYEKVHRVYSMRWLKQAAAAAIILAVGTGIFMLADNNNNADPVITATEPVKTIPNQVIEKSTTPGDINENEPAKSEYADNQKPVIKEIIENRQPSVQYVAIIQPNKKDENHSANVAKESNDFKKPLDIPVRLKNITEADEKMYTKLQQQNINEVVVTNNLPVRTTNEASPETDQPMYVVNVADVEQDNKKIRGFFRKATRIFERTTNIAAANEDDKLLVGGFAINLK